MVAIEMDKKLAHLQMVQGVVSRVSTNSFLLKGWSVVLVSALFAIAATNSKPQFVYLAYFPAAAFWIPDGYFLRQERLFRELYDRVRQMRDEEVDFSMDTSVVKDKVSSWPHVMLSETLLIFHGTVLSSIVLVMFLTSRFGKGG
jgi:hypothetical protein